MLQLHQVSKLGRLWLPWTAGRYSNLSRSGRRVFCNVGISDSRFFVFSKIHDERLPWLDELGDGEECTEQEAKATYDDVGDA